MLAVQAEDTEFLINDDQRITSKEAENLSNSIAGGLQTIGDQLLGRKRPSLEKADLPRSVFMLFHTLKLPVVHLGYFDEMKVDLSRLKCTTG